MLVSIFLGLAALELSPDYAFLLFHPNIYEFLIAEDQTATFCCKECQLVQAFSCQVGQLDTVNLGANRGCNIDNLGSSAQQIGFGGVCTMSSIIMVEVSNVFDLLEWVIEGHVIGVERSAIRIDWSLDAGLMRHDSHIEGTDGSECSC